MDRKYIVYLYTMPNGGVYVGLTSKSIEKRAGKDGKGYLHKDKMTKLYLLYKIADAILEFGWNNIIKEIVASDLTSEEADKLEKLLIKSYREGGRLCYNIADGGNKQPHAAVPINQYDLQGNFIKKWDSIMDAEDFLQIKNAESNISACCLGKRKRAYGYIWRYLNSNLEIVPLKPYRTCIDLFDKDLNYITTYSTIAEASKLTRIHESSISNCLHNKTKTAGGFIWRFSKNSDNTCASTAKLPDKIVCQYDKSTNEYIAEFESVKQAAKETGIQSSHINACCRKGRKSAGGYIWKYKDDI